MSAGLRRAAPLIAIAAGACVALRGSAPHVGGEPPTTATDRATALGAGVTWTHREDRAGPWAINVVAVDLTRRDLELRVVRAKDSLVAREKVAEMAARQPEGAGGVVVAMNADFFDVKTGENENNQVIAGEWWKGLHVTDSPYDAFNTVHAQFAIDAAGRPAIDRYALDGAVIHRGAEFPLIGVNYVSRTALEASALYTPRMGSTPRDSARRVAEVRLREVARRGDTTVLVQVAAPDTTGGHSVRRGELVLAAYGPRATAVRKFAAGDTIVLVVRARSARGDGAAIAPRLLVGGWPQIVRDGESVAARAPWDEATLSSNAEARHPRSAVGLSRDRRKLYLVTVDGRQAASVGMTLVELAGFMRSIGAWNALNFDGGGSTTMVVLGRVVNVPSDSAGPRPVGNALIVVRKTP